MIAELSNHLSTSLQTEIVRALNVQPPLPGIYVRFLGRVVPADTKTARSALKSWVSHQVEQGAFFKRNYLMRAPFISCASTLETGWKWPKTMTSIEKKTIADALVSSRLRALVDVWLDTGWNQNVDESPEKRSLERAPGAHSVVDSFVKKYPPQFILGDFSQFIYQRDGHFEDREVSTSA